MNNKVIIEELIAMIRHLGEKDLVAVYCQVASCLKSNISDDVLNLLVLNRTEQDIGSNDDNAEIGALLKKIVISKGGFKGEKKGYDWNGLANKYLVDTELIRHIIDGSRIHTKIHKVLYISHRFHLSYEEAVQLFKSAGYWIKCKRYQDYDFLCHFLELPIDTFDRLIHKLGIDMYQK